MVNLSKSKTPLLVSFLLVVTACTVTVPNAKIDKITVDQSNKKTPDASALPISISTPNQTPSAINEIPKATPSTDDVNNTNGIKPISIEYSPKYFNLTVGQLAIVKASVNLSNGTKESDFKIKSENSGVLNIENSGVIRAVSAGNTTISIISNRDKSIFVSIPIVVTLEKVLVNSVSINPPSISFKVGDSLSLGATVNLSDGTKNSKVSWLSFNENILKVESTGKITAIASGETKVEATSMDDSGKRTNVNVIISNVDVPLPPPKVVVDTITLSDKSLSLNVGESKKLTASVKFSDGSINSLVNWSSSDGSIVAINQDGTILASNQGQAIITASSQSEPDKKVSIPITINKIPVIVSSLVINTPNTSNLKVGDTISLSATVTKSDGTSNNKC